MKLALIAATIIASLFIAVDSAQADIVYRYHGEIQKVDRCPSDEGEQDPEILPCIWDARHQGNGEGQSFRMTMNGTIIPITHRRAHCRTHWHYTSVCTTYR